MSASASFARAAICARCWAPRSRLHGTNRPPTRGPPLQSAEEEQQQREERGSEPFTGSAVEWVLRKADESLDEIEENPPEYAKVIYDISNGPIGERPCCLAGRQRRQAAAAGRRADDCASVLTPLALGTCCMGPCVVSASAPGWRAALPVSGPRLPLAPPSVWPAAQARRRPPG